MKTKSTLLTLFPFFLFFLLLTSPDKLQAQAPAFGWAHVLGNTGTDLGMKVTVDGAGNSYYIGNFSETIDFDPGPGTFNLTSAGGGDVYILKLSPAGNLMWAKSFGGTLSEGASGIMLDASGNVYVTCTFSSPTVDCDPGPGTYNLINAGGLDFCLLKLDASGNFVSAISWGNAGTEQSRDHKVDGTGNVYLTGSFTGTLDLDPGPGTASQTAAGGFDMFVLKLDASGNLVWVRNFGGTGSDNPSTLDVDASGNIIIAGSFSGTVDFDPGPGNFDLVGPSGDIFILKLDASGNFVWANRIGNTSTENPNSLTTDASGNVYLGGSFQGSAPFDFDPGPGTHNVTATANSPDCFLLKLDAAGNFVWVRIIGSTSTDHIHSIKIDASGNAYAMGTFFNTVDFDPGPGTANMTSAGLTDIFFLKLDAAGNYLWSAREGGTGNDFLSQARIDAAGNIYATGSFNSSANFGGTNYTTAGSNDIFVLKLGDFTTLPLHLLSFNASEEKGGVQLNWTTTNEENVSHFDVERSLDGRNFVPLAQVAARNQSYFEYSYSDRVAFNSNLYYRLKITDIDGSYYYTTVKVLRLTGQTLSVQLGPVPAKDLLTITTGGLPATERVWIQVFNAAGQLVKTGSMQAGNVHTMDISTLGKGNYFIKLSGTANYHSTHQFLKQ